MGGPFWSRKDAGAWTIPKGEHDEAEDPLEAARREFAEEMGVPVPDLPLRGLGTFRQPSGKILTVFAAEADFQPERIESNTFTLERPKGSGRLRDYPEIDHARWFPVTDARARLVHGQLAILDALEESIRAGGAFSPTANDGGHPVSEPLTVVELLETPPTAERSTASGAPPRPCASPHFHSTESYRAQV